MRWLGGEEGRGGKGGFEFLFPGSKGVFLFSVRLIAGPVTNHDSSGRERRGHTTLGSVSGACCRRRRLSCPPPCGSERRTLQRNYCALQQRARRGIEEGPPLPFIFLLHLPPPAASLFARHRAYPSPPFFFLFLLRFSKRFSSQFFLRLFFKSEEERRNRIVICSHLSLSFPSFLNNLLFSLFLWNFSF